MYQALLVVPPRHFATRASRSMMAAQTSGRVDLAPRRGRARRGASNPAAPRGATPRRRRRVVAPASSSPSDDGTSGSSGSSSSSSSSSPSTSAPQTFVAVDPAAPHADPAARVWYVPNFLADDARDAVAAACVKLRSKLRVDHSVAVGRLSAAAPVTSAAYAAFASAPALSKLRQLTSCESLALGDYPVEVRLYRVGSSMGWHTDVRLYDPPQYGAFYTLVPIRPRPRGERRSLRTFPGGSLRPPLAFQSPPSAPFNST